MTENDIETDDFLEPTAISGAPSPVPVDDKLDDDDLDVEDDFEAEDDLGEVAPIVRLIPLSLVAGVLAWAYAPELAWLWETWSSDANYSHGFFVLPVAAWIMHRRLRDVPASPGGRPWMWAWPLLLLVLAARAGFYEAGSRWSDAATLPVVIACLVLALGGWSLFWRLWPAVAFLVFMLPLPEKLNGMLALPLQSMATSASSTLLKVTGLWVLTDGNIIYVGKQPILVAEACNGLSMLMSLAATVFAAAFLIAMPIWTRLVLAISVVPVALLSNVLRIVATAWCYHLLGPERGSEFAHDAAGWLMMPLALAMVFLEVKLLSLLVKEEVEEVQSLLLGEPISLERGPRLKLSVSREVPAANANGEPTSAPPIAGQGGDHGRD